MPQASTYTSALRASGDFLLGTDSSGNVKRFAESGKEVLWADRTYYVRTGGSDTITRTGLTNSDGVAFATGMYALKRIFERIDFNGKTVTLQFQSANEVMTLDHDNNTGSHVGGGRLVIDGGGGSFAGTSWGIKIKPTGFMSVTVQNVTMSASTVGVGCGLQLGNSCYVTIGASCSFGTCGYSHMYAEDDSWIVNTDNYNITGTAPSHAVSFIKSYIFLFPTTVTITAGTYNWTTAFAFAGSKGNIQSTGTTFTTAGVTSTGVRANATSLGLIISGGASYFPGNSAATTATGGIYI